MYAEQGGDVITLILHLLDSELCKGQETGVRLFAKWYCKNVELQADGTWL